MTRDDDRFLDIAGRVSDGERIDWDTLESEAANDAERSLVRSLKVVSDVAEIHGVDGGGAEVSRSFESSPSGLAKVLKNPVRWGDLELREKIGEGAFAEVYRVWDGRLERHVALKLFHQLDDDDDGPPTSRVVDEGRLMAKVHHPNVVAVHNAEERGGRAGIWMDYVGGRTIHDVVKQDGPMSAREAANIGLEVCHALAAVHRAGMIHRDIKAGNVMRAQGGRIFLMDFGAGLDLSRRNAGATRTGTPMYMAPEVFFGEKATPGSDLYSVGVLLYYLVTATYPVRGSTLQDLKTRLERRESCLLRDERPQLPDEFVTIVERALSWNPSARYPTAGAMAQSLAAFLAGEQTVETADLPVVRARRLRRLLAAVVAAAVVTAAAGYLIYLYIIPHSEPTVETAGAARYTIEAGVYRESDGGIQRLEPGARVSRGDRLFLEVEASTDLYFYVVNEDERGHRYALFPVPGLDRSNPIPGGRAHRLPGTRNGQTLTWRVDSAGDREHVVILASPEPIADFETLLAGLPPARLPGDQAPVVPIPSDGEIALRGIGGLAESDAPVARPGREPLHEYARRLTRNPEVVEGVWFRHIEFANPAEGP